MCYQVQLLMLAIQISAQIEYVDEGCHLHLGRQSMCRFQVHLRSRPLL